MLYDIGLTITYIYARPALAGRQILHLMPADLPGLQRRISGSLSFDPAPSERREMQDFFRNAAAEVAFREAHSKITLRMEARVERMADSEGFDISTPWERIGREADEYRGLDPDAPHHFLGRSPRIAPVRAMTTYARENIAPGLTAFDAVTALGRALHRDMRFDPEATNVDTPPVEAFTRRHGVCQDFAQIMIACLRGVGIPAGYVSGFLRTNPPPGKPRLEGADAMHAWVRAWCGRETGWIEYDPTNAMLAGTDHILVARGRDYGDVAPVRGVMRISGGQKTDQAVDVIPVEA